MKNKITSIDRHWFFRELPVPIKILTLIYIRGDMLILAPLLGLIALTYIFSIRFGLIMTGGYIAVRNLGEMIYWFSHQFNTRTYRPYDLGFTKLDNNAIYIIYQTIAIFGVMVGIAFISYALLYA